MKLFWRKFLKAECLTRYQMLGIRLQESYQSRFNTGTVLFQLIMSYRANCSLFTLRFASYTCSYDDFLSYEFDVQTCKHNAFVFIVKLGQ